MAKKNLKIDVNNSKIAKAVNLKGLKDKLAKKKMPAAKPKQAEGTTEEEKEESPRVRARSKSVFAEGAEERQPKPEPIFVQEPEEETVSSPIEEPSLPPVVKEETPVIVPEPPPAPKPLFAPKPAEVKKKKPLSPQQPLRPLIKRYEDRPRKTPDTFVRPPQKERLGPTGRHISDLIPPAPSRSQPPSSSTAAVSPKKEELEGKKRPKKEEFSRDVEGETNNKKVTKGVKLKEFRDVRSSWSDMRSFNARDRQGLGVGEEGATHYRKKKHSRPIKSQEDITIRPSSLKVRLPISIKDLAADMKLKSSQLIAQMIQHGVLATINDLLDDETTVQLLGQELGCEIIIDTSEEDRIRITGQSILDEIRSSDKELLSMRAPVVAFMGHVDHGKTSLIDTIRKTNIASGEAGAITQHIGAFKCHTAVGDIAILDTPGHEAFSAMRSRGASVTDIVVLVVAGDEGIRQQTLEAIEHARQANVNIVVAINKSDKPNFNPENVYRQLAEINLLPEAWGGQTITVNCSAKTGQGITELLEMLAVQAEVLELNADPSNRARGTVLESQLHKGLGAVATVLIQNGTLHKGDAVVCDYHWGRVKTMRDEYGKELQIAGPSTPVEIIGLSGIPEAGQEFVVVKNDKEAREIAEKRQQGQRQKALQKKGLSLENMMQSASAVQKKILNVVLCADVQGSLEALKTALQKIHSDKVSLEIIHTSVGEVSESNIQLAFASKATIIGFHTVIESHAEALVKELGVRVRLHDIIYHAIDDVKELMRGELDKIAKETPHGQAEVRAIFKSSHYGQIAGCMVTDGTIYRNDHVRLIRNGEIIWKGTLSSLRRVKDDVKEVSKGVECGIVLNNNEDILVGDIIDTFGVTYIEQEL